MFVYYIVCILFVYSVFKLLRNSLRNISLLLMILILNTKTINRIICRNRLSVTASVKLSPRLPSQQRYNSQTYLSYSRFDLVWIPESSYASQTYLLSVAIDKTLLPGFTFESTQSKIKVQRAWTA